LTHEDDKKIKRWYYPSLRSLIIITGQKEETHPGEKTALSVELANFPCMAGIERALLRNPTCFQF
jgi:hypothetical protein